VPRSLRLAAALCAAVLVSHAAPARASSGMELALQDDNVFVGQAGMDRDRALRVADRLHVKRIRVNILWARSLAAGATSRKAPAQPLYDFTAVDQLQQEAALHGIRLQLTLTGPAPAWATGNHRVGGRRPSPARFAAFVRTVALHFKGRVDRYSVWNEPNWDTWLGPAAHAPGLYRGLYAAAYKAVKAVDPRAQVLFGELAPQGESHAIAPLKFLRAVFRPGVRLKADGLALHPYQFTRAPGVSAGGPDDATISSLGRVTQLLDKLARRHALTTPRGRHLNLYLTEFGYLTKGARAQTPRVRAAWLADAYRIARRNPRVKQLLQFQLVDGPATQRWHSAVLTRRGAPLPTYRALLRVVKRH
jgi:hypothetical protein